MGPSDLQSAYASVRVRLDFTDAANAHTYVQDDAAPENSTLQAFFRNTFDGRLAENFLRYDAIKKVYCA